MHVAMLQEYSVPFAPGGAEWSTLALARELNKRGVGVTLVSLDLADREKAGRQKDFDEQLRSEGIGVTRIGFPLKMKGPPQVFASYVFGNRLTEWRLTRKLLQLELKADLWHVQGLGMVMPVWRAVQQRKLPWLATLRDYRAMCPLATCLQEKRLPPIACSERMYRDCAREYLRLYDQDLGAKARWYYFLRRDWEWQTHRRQIKALGEADAIVFVSEAVRKIYRAGGLEGRNPVVVHNLPAPLGEAAAPDEMRSRFKLNGPILLFVGRWSVGKGAKEMAEAWSSIYQAHPEAHLVIVGRRESKAEPFPPENVVFTGQLDHAEVMGLMQAAYAVLLPSRWPEPYSRVALEAMAAGKPIVATVAGGNEELVRDEETGFLTPGHDPPAYALRVNNLLDNPEMAQRFGQNGRERLEAELAAGPQLDKLCDLYQEILDKRG